MSMIYTFQDMKQSCRHFSVERPPKVWPFSIGNQAVPVCKHPDNRQPGETRGYCDENVCPIIRAILDDGEEWE